MKTASLLSIGFVLSLLASACASEAPLSGDDDDDDDSGATSDGAGAASSAGAGGAPSSTSGAGPSATSGTGGVACSGIFGGACGVCLEGACCSQLATCDTTAGCVDCVTGEGASGCEDTPAANALLQCASNSCLADCFEGSSSSGTGGGSSSSSGSGGGGGGFDLVNCTGPASASGTVLGVTPDPSLGYVWPDPSGALAVALYPQLATNVGDVTVGIYFFPSPGQLDYPPNGTVGCAILEDAGSSWSVVDTTQLCEVHLAQLQFASAPDVCDGVIEGTFQGIFSGNAPLAGVFSLPLEVAESQTSPPSCQPPNGPCSQNSDCCTQSCSMFIGVCN